MIELWRGRGRGARVHLDARRPVGPADRERLARLGLPGPFLVITACHPGGRPQSEAERRACTARLARDLRRAGVRRPVRADGGSPDRTHVEPGWAAAVDSERGRDIAAAHGQSALFRFDGRSLWIDPVLVDAAPVRLPVGSPGGM